MPTSWRSTASRRVSRATPTSACGSTNSRRASSPLSSMTIERCAEQFAGAPLHCPQNLGFPLAGLAHNGFAIVIINGCVHAPDTDAKSRPTHMRGGGGGGGAPTASRGGGVWGGGGGGGGRAPPPARPPPPGGGGGGGGFDDALT